MKIIFMGTPDFAVPLLDAIKKAGHDIVCVVTQPDRAKDRGKKIQYTPVKEKALDLGITVLQPEKVKNNQELLDSLQSYRADIAVVVAYGQLLPKEILSLPRFGCINVHASLLPRLRGASPIQRAIVDGESKTGVTIMQMEEGLDTGDMLAKCETEIGFKNYEQLHDELSEMGAKLLVETLPTIESGLIKPEKQNDTLSTYAGIICKADGKVDFKQDAISIDRLVRGFDPWPGAFCNYDLMQIKIWKAKAIEANCEIVPGTIIKVSDQGILVACGQGELLIEEMQVPGKKRVSVKDYIRGNTLEIGKILR